MAKINSNSACRLSFDAYNLNGDRIVIEANIGNLLGGFSGLSYKTFTANSDIDFVKIRAVREDVVSTEKKTVVYEKIMLLQGTYTTEQPFEPYKETLSTIPTDGLAGIKVSSNGNYTDQNGQQWICDEIVKYADGSGAYIQRTKKKVLSESTSITRASHNNVYRYQISNVLNGMVKAHITRLISNVFIPHSAPATGTNIDNTICGWDGGATAYVICNTYTDVESFTQMLIDTNAYVLYQLAEPICTPLTAEEIAEISTFYPITNISNDFDCGMKVTYLADSKNYVDKKLELQAKAREEEMMAMFLLLPDEVQAAMIENDTNNLMSGMED